MSDKEQDLLGKIDAMLERSDADLLIEKRTSNDDFPVLTEVIEEESNAESVGLDRRSSRQESGRRLAERRISQRRQSSQTDPPASSPRNELECQIAALEDRLTALFVRQQSHIEETLRKAVRDFMERDEGSSS